MSQNMKGKKRGPYGSAGTDPADNSTRSPIKSHKMVINKLRDKLEKSSASSEMETFQEETLTDAAFIEPASTEADTWTHFELKSLNAVASDAEFQCTDRDDEFEPVDHENFTVDFMEEFMNKDPDNDLSGNQANPDEYPLYSGAKVNFGTFMLLISLFVSKHNLAGDAINQLLQILSYLLPEGNGVVTSLYSFKQYFKTLKNPLKHHYYCPKCLNIVDKHLETNCTQEFCQKSFKDTNLPYFLEIPIADQLRSLFSQKGFFLSIQGRFGRNANSCSDIYDGSLYKALFENNGPLSKPENVSFILNTDGAPVFKSSNISIWPLFLTINELDIKQRMLPENMILAGLWFGSLKPAMCTFLKPFVASMKKLYSGIQCLSPERGAFICKSFLIAATADLPAKALLCNSVQYNGSYACWHCLQKGETAKRGKGHVHVFPFNQNCPKGPVRNMSCVLADAQSVIDSGQMNLNINGVKGPSWLSFCPKFDMINGLAIDYMHGVLLGVQKLLLRLWFSKEFSSQVYSFSKDVTTVDKRLISICPTLDMTRIPRSIQADLKYWKASEFQNFLLFYSIPILSDILDSDRFLHYSLFVNAIFILLQSKLREQEICKAEVMLFNFCRKFSDLYDRSFMTLNIHHLVHLADHVRSIGPLYTHSCFPFENKNGLILKMIKGTQNIDQQIVTGVSFIQKLPELKQRFVEKGSCLDSLCHMIESPNVLKRGKKITQNAYILGGVNIRKLTNSEFQSLSTFLGKAPFQDTFQSFNRLEIKSQIIYSKNYSRMVKRNNSFIQFTSQNTVMFGQVCFFLHLEFIDVTVALVDCFECSEKELPTNHIIHVKKSEKLAVVPIEDIHCLIVVVEVEDKGVYLCKFPNTLNIT